MKTPINSIINWIDEINNSIFALQASEIELKLLAQFKAKLIEKLPLEKDFVNKTDINKFIDSHILTNIDDRYPYLEGYNSGLETVKKFINTPETN